MYFWRSKLSDAESVFFFSWRDMVRKNGVGLFRSFLWHRGPSIFTRQASFVANVAHIGELITTTQVPNRSQGASYAPWWIVSWIQTVLTSGTCLNRLLEWFGTWVVVINSPIWAKFATKLPSRVNIEGPRCHKKDQNMTTPFFKSISRFLKKLEGNRFPHHWVYFFRST